MNRQQRRAAERQGKVAPHLGGAAAWEPIFAQAVQAHQAGRLAEADALLARIPQSDRRGADALHLRGVIALQNGQPATAEPMIGRAIALDGQVAGFHNNHGMALRGLGRLAEAQAAFRRATTLRPDYAMAWSNLGETLAALGRPQEAIDALGQVVRLAPRDLKAVWLRAGLLHDAGRIGEAVAAFRHVVALAPREADAHNGLGNALANLGDLPGAVAAYRQALALAPGDLAARSNLIMTLHSLADVSAADILDEARAFAAQVEPRRAPVFDNPPDPERPLRVGYVSADFREHPVGFFLDRVLAAHDPSAVEIFLYSNSPWADAHTARLRSAAAGWREIAGRSDAEAQAMIFADRIDILVDLAGHTGANRLALFGMRSAPVQASWLGYFGTTGLAAVDYVIADDIVAPPEDAPHFSEAIIRLQAPYLCWSPPVADVPTAPFPAMANGFVTFGCFNNRAKLNDETLAAWAKVLHRVPASRLLLKTWALGDHRAQAFLADAFARQGGDPDRLIFEGLSPREAGLAAYNRVDIALDPFPFGGCTTTADTLWMGVPLVTVAGARWSGRMSADILAAVGRPDWVAADVAAYVDLAVDLAGRLGELAPVRAGLRARLEASAFCDGASLARRLEGAYREMWREWCARPR